MSKPISWSTRLHWKTRRIDRSLRAFAKSRFAKTLHVAWLTVGTIAILFVALYLWADVASYQQQRTYERLLPPANGYDHGALGGSRKDNTRTQTLLSSRSLKDAEIYLQRIGAFSHGARLLVGDCSQIWGSGGSDWDDHTRSARVCVPQLTYRQTPSGIHQTENDIADAGVFVTLHEFGHALVSDRHLHVLGREEDAVDIFATITAVKINHPEIAEAGAGFFDSIGFWPMDVHSPGAARAGLVRCLLYGSDPKHYGYLAKRYDLPQNGRANCVRLWQQETTAWNAVLHLRSHL